MHVLTKSTGGPAGSKTRLAASFWGWAEAASPMHPFRPSTNLFMKSHEHHNAGKRAGLSPSRNPIPRLCHRHTLFLVSSDGFPALTRLDVRSFSPRQAAKSGRPTGTTGSKRLTARRYCAYGSCSITPERSLPLSPFFNVLNACSMRSCFLVFYTSHGWFRQEKSSANGILLE